MLRYQKEQLFNKFQDNQKQNMSKVIAHSLFTEFDINLFKAGKHYKLYKKFGSHITTVKVLKERISLFGLQALKTFL